MFIVFINHLITFFVAVKRYELTDCSQEVVALISHAVQERLKTLVEKLGVIAEHRQEQFKVCLLESNVFYQNSFVCISNKRIISTTK